MEFNYRNKELEARVKAYIARDMSKERALLLEAELSAFDGDVLPEDEVPPFIRILGRNGVGKSIFERNFNGSPLFLEWRPLLMDRDRFELLSRQYTEEKKPALCRAYQNATIGTMLAPDCASLGVPVVQVAAVGFPPPLCYSRPENRGETIQCPIPVTHVFHAGFETCKNRILKRVAAGLHPYTTEEQAIEGMKASGISGHINPFLAALDSDQVVLWDGETDFQVRPMAHIFRQDNQFHIACYDMDSLQRYGLPPEVISKTLAIFIASADREDINIPLVLDSESLILTLRHLPNPDETLFFEDDFTRLSYDRLTQFLEMAFTAHEWGSFSGFMGAVERIEKSHIHTYQVPDEQRIPIIDPTKPWTEQRNLPAPNTRWLPQARP